MPLINSKTLILALIISFSSGVFADGAENPSKYLLELIKKNKQRDLNLDEEIKNFKKHLNILSTEEKLKFHDLECDYYNKKYSDEKALEFCKDYLEIAKAADSIEHIVVSNKKLAMIYVLIGMYSLSEKHYTEAIEWAEQSSNYKELASLYNSIGVDLAIDRNPAEAIEYYNKALQFEKKREDRDFIHIIFENTISAYIDLKEYETALTKIIEHEPIIDTLDTYNAANIDALKGKLYLGLEDYETSIHYFNKYLEVINKLGNWQERIQGYYFLTKLYDLKNDMANSGKYLEKQFEIINDSEVVKSPMDYLDTYQQAFNFHKRSGNYEKALSYLEQYNSVKNEMENKSSLVMAQSIKFNAELAEKELELSDAKLLKVQSELQLEKNKQESYVFKLIAAVTLIVFAIGLLLLYMKKVVLSRLNTKLNNALDDLKDTQEQLIESERFASLGNLVAGVAHEINTPVGISVTASTYISTLIKNLTKKVDSQSLSAEDYQKFKDDFESGTEILSSNLKRTHDLISNFKQLSTDQSNEKLKEFNLLQLINNTLVSLTPMIKTNKIEISVNCRESLVINSYPGLYSQVLVNLIMNSIIHGFGFTEKGSIERAPDKSPKIQINAHSENEKLYLSVMDNGNGMEEETIEQIFEPFFTTNAANGGTGLGLHITHNIITQALNGSIECQSKPKEYTQFNIVIELNNIRDELKTEE